MERETFCTDKEWELEVMENFSESEEPELLDLAQHIATALCNDLSQLKAAVRFQEPTEEEKAYMVLHNIGRMAVMLDVLQLRYGDAAEHELEFLEGIEKSFE